MCDEHLRYAAREYYWFLKAIPADSNVKFAGDHRQLENVDAILKWLRQDVSNYYWLVDAFDGVGDECVARFGDEIYKDRQSIINDLMLLSYYPPSKYSGPTAPPQLCPRQFRIPTHVGGSGWAVTINSYRAWYHAINAIKKMYTKTSIPQWMFSGSAALVQDPFRPKVECEYLGPAPKTPIIPPDANGRKTFKKIVVDKR